MMFAANSPEISRENTQPLSIDNTFVADCTLYLENETLIRRKIPGRWYSTTPPDAEEWLKQARHCLDWIVGTLHIHDPKIPCQVDRYVVHHWHKEQNRARNGAASSHLRTTDTRAARKDGVT